MRQRHLPGHGQLAPADQVPIGDGVVEARNGRVVTTAVCPPVRPATLWIRVVSRVSARRIVGRRVARHRASIDLPAPGGPSRRTLWSQRLHHL
jgi:hypothetical protein